MPTIRFASLALVGLCLCSCGEEKQTAKEQQVAEEQHATREQYPTVSEEVVQGIARTNLDHPDPTQAQLDRKARSIEIVKDLDLPYIEHLPVVEDAAQVDPRDAQEVAQRCIALLMCAVKGELRGVDDAFIPDLVEEWSAAPYFSPNESDFMADSDPTPQEYLDNSWGYECVHVLLWALGHLDELQPPNTICDVPTEVALVRELGADAFVENASLRDIDEILDAADLYYRLHWAAIELRLNGETSPHVDEGIIRERHRALNWLIRYMDAEWDDVTTDTYYLHGLPWHCAAIPRDRGTPGLEVWAPC
ncbi:MAG: DUF4272 domain-containing protein [Planctomycetota bacterium]